MSCPHCTGTDWVEVSPRLHECTPAVETLVPEIGPPGLGRMRPLYERCGTLYEPGISKLECRCGSRARGYCRDCTAPVCVRHCRGRVPYSLQCESCRHAHLVRQENEEAAARAHRDSRRLRGTVGNLRAIFARERGDADLLVRWIPLAGREVADLVPPHCWYPIVAEVRKKRLGGSEQIEVEGLHYRTGRTSTDEWSGSATYHVLSRDGARLAITEGLGRSTFTASNEISAPEEKFPASLVRHIFASLFDHLQWSGIDQDGIDEGGADEGGAETGGRQHRNVARITGDALVEAAGFAGTAGAIAKKAGLTTRRGKISKVKVVRAAMRPGQTASRLLDATVEEIQERRTGRPPDEG